MLFCTFSSNLLHHFGMRGIGLGMRNDAPITHLVQRHLRCSRPSVDAYVVKHHPAQRRCLLQARLKFVHLRGVRQPRFDYNAACCIWYRLAAGPGRLPRHLTTILFSLWPPRCSWLVWPFPCARTSLYAAPYLLYGCARKQYLIHRCSLAALRQVAVPWFWFDCCHKRCRSGARIQTHRSLQLPAC